MTLTDPLCARAANSQYPNWLTKSPFGPIVLPPLERLLPEGSGWPELVSRADLLALPRKIQLAPTRAVYPMWLHCLPWL